MKKKPNILLFGIDSQRADHMSVYGYGRNTTPHISRFAEGATLFENCFSAHIPTTSGYANMLTRHGLLRHSNVALRHKGGMRPGVRTLQEMVKESDITPVVSDSAALRIERFDKYTVMRDGQGGGWIAHKAESLNKVPSRVGTAGTAVGTIPALFAPHGPAYPVSAAPTVSANVLSWR